jgi:phosphoadenosine phosphosulfate reductase
MTKLTIDDRLKKDLNEKTPQEVLKWAYDNFDNIAISTSMQSGGIILIDMAKKAGLNFRVFTIDTGRLPEETYLMMDQIRENYGIDLEVYFPNYKKVEELVRGKGLYSFKDNIDNRLECCYIRKVEPLQRALTGLDAWVTSLRKTQSNERSQTSVIEIDKAHNNIAKINPLANWTEQNILDYVQKHKVPRHPLYAEGYTSIGCEPCTRPIQIGEDQRAGRWWWELTNKKECGLHYII